MITRNIWLLSFISLCTDLASEMLYPIMPVYLKHIGFSVALIGVLEGLAEAVAGLSKGFFGQWSDRLGRRRPFVQVGYALSAVSKPMLALCTFPWWVFLARTLDRLGKGVRTGARDALLSDETTPAYKARVFGFHRTMDTLGAVGGPMAALLFLTFFPKNYTTLFIVAFFPGLLAVTLTLLIREKKRPLQETAAAKRPGLLDFIRYWTKSPRAYRWVAGPLLLFTLVNSSDAFLLLYMKERGFSDSSVIYLYMWYNLTFAMLAYPAGWLADRLGMRWMLATGLLAFAVVYGGMAINTIPSVFYGLFILYGTYAAATEGIAKAWLTNLCRREDTATAIGTFAAFQSVATLVASSLTGLIWLWTGAAAAFLLTAIVALGVAVYFAILKIDK